MNPRNADEISMLRLTLHGRLVGYLAGYQDGRNVLTFADEFRLDSARLTFSLITHPEFPNAEKLMAEPWQRSYKLHPTFSNLLPEGALREMLAQTLKVHVDNDFHLFTYLGADLPGALIADPMAPENIPESVLAVHGKARAVAFEKGSRENAFSLAGIQMKFSTKHKDVPINEFTSMTLASMSGIDIPEIKLVELDKLDNLPPINLPDEKLAFAIKRFDRSVDQRIHMEDFAQVLVKYPHEKYDSASYEQIGKILYRYSGDGLADAQQFARRLLVNILLANGDAHIKNWSLLYADQVTPRLSPAYDIVTTSVYIEKERCYALNLGKTKEWYRVTFEHFEAWAKRAGVPWRAIRPHLEDTMERVRSLWPQALKELPMNDGHKEKLKSHWAELQLDFRL